MRAMIPRIITGQSLKVGLYPLTKVRTELPRRTFGWPRRPWRPDRLGLCSLGRSLPKWKPCRVAEELRQADWRQAGRSPGHDALPPPQRTDRRAGDCTGVQCVRIDCRRVVHSCIGVVVLVTPVVGRSQTGRRGRGPKQGGGGDSEGVVLSPTKHPPPALGLSPTTPFFHFHYRTTSLKNE